MAIKMQSEHKFNTGSFKVNELIAEPPEQRDNIALSIELRNDF